MEKGRKRAEEGLAKVKAEVKRRAEWEAAGIIAEAKQRVGQIIQEAKKS